MRTQEIAVFVGRLRDVVAYFRDRRGTAFAEFAIVGPVLLMLTIGTVDVGRLVWSSAMLHHLAREATRLASIRGADSSSPVDESDIESFAQRSCKRNSRVECEPITAAHNDLSIGMSAL